MSKYESSIKIIPYSQSRVFSKISDLNNFNGVEEKLPKEKIQDLTFDADSVSFSVSPVGNVSLKVVERTPDSCVKLETVTSPLPFTLWVQVVPVGEDECKMKVTVEASLNPFIKGMVQKPLKEGLEKMVTVLSMIEY